MALRLTGKVALVTGGGKGLGRGIAERFAAEGAAVAILEIDADATRDIEAGLKRAGADVIAMAGDVTKLADIRNIIAACVGKWGRLDILVNNAGVASAQPSSLVDMPLEEWQRVMAVNLDAALYCMRETVPVMKKTGGGSVINMTSIAARSSYPNSGAYSISKAALEALTRQAAVEFGPFGIRVNSMSLGWFRTALNEHVYQAPGTLARRNATIPLGRIGTAQDCAQLALFLASDESTYITGESFEADGGLLASALSNAVELAKVRPLPE